MDAYSVSQASWLHSKRLSIIIIISPVVANYRAHPEQASFGGKPDEACTPHHLACSTVIGKFTISLLLVGRLAASFSNSIAHQGLARRGGAPIKGTRPAAAASLFKWLSAEPDYWAACSNWTQTACGWHIGRRLRLATAARTIENRRVSLLQWRNGS